MTRPVPSFYPKNRKKKAQTFLNKMVEQTWSKDTKNAQRNEYYYSDRCYSYFRVVVVGFIGSDVTEVNVSCLDFTRRLDALRYVSSGFGQRHSKRRQKTRQICQKKQIIMEKKEDLSL